MIEDGNTFTVTHDDFFRTLAAKIFFVRCWSRPDLKTALAFLTTQVQNPDRYGYQNLTCTMRHIRETQGMELNLEAETVDTTQWWIEAAYGMYPDLK